MRIFVDLILGVVDLKGGGGLSATSPLVLLQEAELQFRVYIQPNMQTPDLSIILCTVLQDEISNKVRINRHSSQYWCGKCLEKLQCGSFCFGRSVGFVLQPATRGTLKPFTRFYFVWVGGFELDCMEKLLYNPKQRSQVKVPPKL